MSYSCTDFTDSILDALGIEVPEESWDSPSDQADLALAEIDRRSLTDRELATVLAALRYWQGITLGNPAGLAAIQLPDRLSVEEIGALCERLRGGRDGEVA